MKIPAGPIEIEIDVGYEAEEVPRKQIDPKYIELDVGAEVPLGRTEQPQEPSITPPDPTDRQLP